MDVDTVIQLATNAMQITLKVAMPMLLAGLGVGLIVSIFQAITQIQEQTLTFIPKILALALIMVLLGPWMLNQILGYTTELWLAIPNLVSS
jgi:flagellar biosynthesis protein FliQ